MRRDADRKPSEAAIRAAAARFAPARRRLVCLRDLRIAALSAALSSALTAAGFIALT